MFKRKRTLQANKSAKETLKTLDTWVEFQNPDTTNLIEKVLSLIQTHSTSKDFGGKMEYRRSLTAHTFWKECNRSVVFNYCFVDGLNSTFFYYSKK